MQLIKSEINNPATDNSRRNFLKKTALGGIALGGLMHLSVEDTIAQTTSNVQPGIKSVRSEDYRYAYCHDS